MHLLLDYSQTNRHLKIQNTFSTKKHPIYYTYDPITYQTYITKVVQSQANVINYYKHHIHNNILPYLQRKRQIKYASILTIPIENAEVVVKIDQKERIRREELVKEKINQVASLLKKYHLYHDSSLFQQQINQISSFINRISLKQADTNYKIQSINEAIANMPELLTFISKININDSNANEKLQSLPLSEQEQQQYQNFKAALHMIDKYKNKQGVLNEQTLKPHQLSQVKNILEKLSIYLSNTVYSLKKISESQKTNSNNEIEEIYYQLLQHQRQLQIQQKSIYESNVLFITRKFIKGKTLREMILNKDDRLTPQFCFDLTKSIVDFIFMNGGVKDLFITTQNIIVEDSGAFHINYFSFVGIQFIKLNKFVFKADFQEILPYLHSKYLEMPQDFDTRVLLRFIIINFVSAFFKRDFIFDPKQVDFQNQVRNQSSLQEQVHLIQKKLMNKTLTKEQKKRIKTLFDNVYKVNYSQVVQSVFNYDKRSTNLSWENIFSMLSRNNLGTQSNLILSKEKIRANILDISKNYLSYPAQLITDELYIIDISIMQVIDHYGLILQQICNTQLAKLSKRNQDRVSKIAANLKYQREYFKEKEWYFKEIYIPVKMQMTYTEILNYFNWIHMLNSQTQPNIQTVKAVQTLLSFLLQVEEVMKIIEPLITDSIIEKSFNQSFLYYSDGQTKQTPSTYYAHIIQYCRNDQKKKLKASKNRNDSQEDQVMFESSEQQQDKDTQTLKKLFWKCFFSTIIIVYRLIKKYYIRINEVIKGEIAINSGKYIKLLQQFKPEIPKLTTQK